MFLFFKCPSLSAVSHCQDSSYSWGQHSPTPLDRPGKGCCFAIVAIEHLEHVALVACTMAVNMWKKTEQWRFCCTETEDEPADLGGSPCFSNKPILDHTGTHVAKPRYTVPQYTWKRGQAVPGNLCALLQPRACRDLSTWIHRQNAREINTASLEVT